MNSIVSAPPERRSGSAALIPEPAASPIGLLAHTSWCDPGQHSDGAANALPDPGEQVCCADLCLELGPGSEGRSPLTARLGLIYMHPHPDVRNDESETTLNVSVDGWDGLVLPEGHIEPIAYGMLERVAMLRGQVESATRWRLLAQTSASSQTPAAT